MQDQKKNSSLSYFMITRRTYISFWFCLFIKWGYETLAKLGLR